LGIPDEHIKSTEILSIEGKYAKGKLPKKRVALRRKFTVSVESISTPFGPRENE